MYVAYLDYTLLSSQHTTLNHRNVHYVVPYCMADGLSCTDEKRPAHNTETSWSNYDRYGLQYDRKRIH